MAGGSAIGGLGGLTSSLGTQLGEIGQAERIGSGIFQANSDYAQATAIGGIGQSASQFGSQLFNNAPAIGRIGSTLFQGQTNAA